MMKCRGVLAAWWNNRTLVAGRWLAHLCNHSFGRCLAARTRTRIAKSHACREKVRESRGILLASREESVLASGQGNTKGSL